MGAEDQLRKAVHLPHLRVTNFGPIRKADLELRPLSIFVGPSNSGKSYLAILLYALHRYISGQVQRASHTIYGFLESEYGNSFPEEQRSLREAHKEWVQFMSHSRQGETSGRAWLSIPSTVSDFLRQILGTLSQAGLQQEITRCFGMEATAFHRKGSTSNPKAVLRSIPVWNNERIESRLSLNSDHSHPFTALPEDWKLHVAATEVDRAFQWAESSESFESRASAKLPLIWLTLTKVINIVAGFFYGSFSKNAYYLPADRTGIMHAHRAIVGAVLENVPMAGIHPVPSLPLLSGITADFLSQLIRSHNPNQLTTQLHKDNALSHVCAELENRLLDGAVQSMNSQGLNYPEWKYQPRDWQDSIPLTNASSMVSELAPVVLYLRHLVAPGNTLIIEEPESHLHPAKQVQFARQLAAIGKAGVRVIITTHSEWVLDEFANLVGLSSVPASARNSIDGGAFALEAAQVGAWLFKHESEAEGSTLAQIDIDESGLYPAGFEEVAIQLHNNWSSIFSKSEYGDD